MARIILILASLIALVASVRIGFLNDIHLDLEYESKCLLLCKNKGIYGQNPPLKLLETALKDMSRKFKKDKALDLIVVTGDLVKHGLSSDDDTVDNWDEMKETIATVMTAIKEGYPDTPILGSIGNNDVKFHYQATADDDKVNYYGDMFDMWFTNISANSDLASNSDIETTFMDGGYYRYDISSDLALISINSVLLNKLNSEDLDTASTMITWLDDQFSSSPSTKFILAMHIFPGMLYFTSDLQFWHEDLMEDYFSVLDTYSDQILLSVGSHIHSNEIRAPSGADVLQLATIALTPKDYNNPGYSVIEIDTEEGVQEVIWRSMQLYWFLLFRITTFNTIKPENIFNIDMNDLSDISDWTSNLQTKLGKFTKYMGAKVGFPWILTNVASFFLDIFFKAKIKNLQLHYVCSMKYYYYEEYTACVEEFS